MGLQGLPASAIVDSSSTGRTVLTGTAEAARFALEVERDQFGRRTTGYSPYPRQVATAQIQANSGLMRSVLFVASKSVAISALRVFTTGAAGATPTIVRMGVYSVSGTAMTLLASTTNDTTIFSSASTSYQRNLDVSVNLSAGSLYAFGVLVVTGASLPFYAGISMFSSLSAALAPEIGMNVSGLSNLPSSATGNTGNNSCPYIEGVT